MDLISLNNKWYEQNIINQWGKKEVEEVEVASYSWKVCKLNFLLVILPTSFLKVRYVCWEMVFCVESGRSQRASLTYGFFSLVLSKCFILFSLSMISFSLCCRLWTSILSLCVY